MAYPKRASIWKSCSIYGQCCKWKATRLLLPEIQTVPFTKRALRESPIRKALTWIIGWHCSMNMTRRSVFLFTRINSQMLLTAEHRCSIPAPIGTTVFLHKPCRMHLLPSFSRRTNGKLNSAEKNCFSVISAKIQRSWQNAAFYPKYSAASLPKTAGRSSTICWLQHPTLWLSVPMMYITL